ncbi:MAG TPA: DUF3710 domain-containing protein [Mycobacteriales bacterium]|jgi:hypothetical protein|nr:DUF3710 domain-containing protein [Mycobacteriales bacterium]
MFGRRKRGKDEPDGAEAVAAVDEADPADDRAAADDADDDLEFVDDLDEEDRAYEDALLLAEIEAREARPVVARPQGPWDAADAPADDVVRIDLGGLLVPVPDQTDVRVDVTNEGVVFAATLVHAGSAVQVNAFAAPRTEGIWAEVLDEIAQSLAGSGGRVERLDGRYGPELRADVPTQLPGQEGIVLAPARFVGVDGPRWFLRAMYTGPAAVDPDAAAPLEAAVTAVVVVRGAEPMAVRDPIALRLPVDTQAAPAEAEDEDDDDPLTLAERGPEITEIR